MTNRPDISVQHGDIGPMEYLARGGQATVHRLTSFRLPDVQGELVLKKYKKGQGPPPHGLNAIVGIRNEMEVSAKAKLDSLAAWPTRVVFDGGDLVGVLIPLIAGSYFQDMVLPSGKRTSNPRELQFLFIDPRQASKLGYAPPSLSERFAILRDLAFGLGMLHKNGVVFGDVNAKNALYRTTSEPTVMFVDCDAVRIRGSAAVVRQYHSPDWEPPEGGPGTIATDLYKLGLLVLRILSPAEFNSISRDPTRADPVLDADGRTMLRRALGADTKARPTAKEWVGYLRSAARGRPIIVASATGATAPAPPAPLAPAHGGWAKDAAGKWVRR